MDIEQMISEYEQEHYGGNMPARNKEVLRFMLKKEEETNDLANRDYNPSDEGMHWSD